MAEERKSHKTPCVGDWLLRLLCC